MSDIKQYILSLSLRERVNLIAFIASSLEEEADKLEINIPNHIVEESRHLFKDWDAEKVDAVSWQEFRQELKNKYLNA
ncbi:MAG: hypothetical protein AAF696_36370 [Bacteroidota bacterium]